MHWTRKDNYRISKIDRVEVLIDQVQKAKALTTI